MNTWEQKHPLLTECWFKAFCKCICNLKPVKEVFTVKILGHLSLNLKLTENEITKRFQIKISPDIFPHVTAKLCYSWVHLVYVHKPMFICSYHLYWNFFILTPFSRVGPPSRLINAGISCSSKFSSQLEWFQSGFQSKNIVTSPSNKRVMVKPFQYSVVLQKLQLWSIGIFLYETTRQKNMLKPKWCFVSKCIEDQLEVIKNQGKNLALSAH